MTTQSLWTSISKNITTNFPSFSGRKKADIVIIGGGISGITTAFELEMQGQRVLLLEANKIATGTTGNSTGNLYVTVGPYYQTILKYHSELAVNAIIQARADCLDYIETIVSKHEIVCNFQRRPFYYFTNTNQNLLQTEMDLLTKAGIAVEKNKLINFSIPFQESLLIPNQAKFNPLAYVLQLALILQQQNSEIYENSPVLSVTDKGNYILIETDKGQIEAKQVVVTTHIPKGINLSSLLAPAYRSYAVAVKLNTACPVGQFWGMDEEDYILSSHSSDINDPELNVLIAAGNHHRTGQSPCHLHNFNLIETYLRKHFAVKEIVTRWSAQHYQAADKLPYIGPVNKKKTIYIATGFYADGLVYGTIAAQIIVKLLMKKKHPLAEIVHPFRLASSKSLMSMLEEAGNTFKEYATDFPFGSNLAEIETIEPEQGKVILINGEKYAVYKENNRTTHIVSAVCTHMKCIVNWNDAEKTWDCPCHGSRFTVKGGVIEGPAYQPLKNFNYTGHT